MCFIFGAIELVTHDIPGSILVFQKSFIDEVKKAISSHHSGNKSLTEGAAVTCVRLCKASTYINIKDRLNVLFTLVQSVIQDLKVCMCVFISSVHEHIDIVH